MLTGLLHRVVAQPWVYDLVQRAVGVKYVRRRLAERIGPLRTAGTVLDIGGGTGGARELWSAQSRYICLDIDPVKLVGYAAKNPDGLALLADATDIPIVDGGVDAVVSTLMTHHLTDPMLERMVAEAARILKPAGRLVLLDGLWVETLWSGRLLWKYDRGSCPRTGERLRAVIEGHFEVEVWEEFAVWHRYAMVVARPRARAKDVLTGDVR